MEAKQLYVAGFVLGLVGSLVTAASLILGGLEANAVLMLGVTFTLALGLRSVFTNEAFDRDHELAYRLANWGMAVFVVGLGFFLLAIGVASLGAFG